MNNSFFPERTKANPIIYAYSDSKFPNMLKVGFTSRSIEDRMKEHYPTLVPSEKLPYKVELVESGKNATYPDKPEVEGYKDPEWVGSITSVTANDLLFIIH